MVEIKAGGKYTLEDFEVEYKYGNFVDGNRLMPYKQFISKVEKGEITQTRGGGYHDDIDT